MAENAKTISDRAQEDLVSEASLTEYLLKVSALLSAPKSDRRNQSALPFFLEVVDSNLTPSKIDFPPLKTSVLGVKMLVNPATISNNMAKIINRTQSMVGWVEDHWGEELDTITFQGRTATFIVDSSKTYPDRRLSVSYREFQKLIPLMASNGCTFDKFGFVNKRLFLMLTYDYAKYIGYLESMDVTEDAMNPFTFNYTITFKAERTIYSFVTR